MLLCMLAANIYCKIPDIYASGAFWVYSILCQLRSAHSLDSELAMSDWKENLTGDTCVTATRQVSLSLRSSIVVYKAIVSSQDDVTIGSVCPASHHVQKQHWCVNNKYCTVTYRLRSRDVWNTNLYIDLFTMIQWSQSGGVDTFILSYHLPFVE